MTANQLRLMTFAVALVALGIGVGLLLSNDATGSALSAAALAVMAAILVTYKDAE